MSTIDGRIANNEPIQGKLNRLWVRIENTTETSNQAFKIQINDNDTVDDLKDRILERLNGTRWKNLNDNASISLGIYTLIHPAANTTISDTNNPNSNISDTTQPSHLHSRGTDSGTLHSPIDIIPNLFQKPDILHSPTNGTTTPTSIQTDSHISTPQPNNHVLSKLSTLLPGNNTSPSPKTFTQDTGYIETSPQRACSTSPKLTSVPRTSIIRPNSVSMTQSVGQMLHLGNYISPTNRMYAQSRLLPNETVRNQTNQSQQKNISKLERLNFTTELVNKTTYTFKVVFQPDELAINIFHYLFNGSQPASDPLLIFSSANLSIERSISFDTGNNQNKVDLPPISSKPIDIANNDTFNGRHIAPLEVGEGSDEGNQNGKISISSPNEYKTYKLITNEKQLQEASKMLTKDDQLDGMETSPKQAILLLPKGFAGEHQDVENSESLHEELNRNYENQKDIQEAIFSHLNAKEASSNSSSSENLTRSLDVSLQESETSAFIQQHHHIPLNEQEVGLIDSMEESEWQKKHEQNSEDYTERRNEGDSPTSKNSGNRYTEDDKNGDIAIARPHTRPLPKGRPLPHLARSHARSLTSSAQKSTSERVFPKINVLIVEDNVINQAILGSFLRKHKISYKVAKNGKEAVDIWKEGGLHLIFMDLQLPVLSGIEAAKQIRNFEKEQKSNANQGHSSPPVIIVALTASNSIEDKRNALISGCNDYLTKPVNLHWLSKKITEWGCMQALIDFDSWKQGQSRMTDSFHKKSNLNANIGVAK